MNTFITVGQLRAHLEGPDHRAVMGPRPARWMEVHRRRHAINFSLIPPTDHERTQKANHDITHEGA